MIPALAPERRSALKDRTAAPMGSFLPLIADIVRSSPNSGQWQIQAEGASGWIHARHKQGSPLQGWKLHLSASEHSAAELLRRALPTLLEETASFKATASYAVLNDLNEGHGGMSQVGKFVTVYPNDDAQAVRLAVALDRAILGLRGPRIPSDRPLRVGSPVHYRYGGFGDLFMQLPIGQIVPALRTPSGELVPDERQSRYAPPDWVKDPFIAAGIADLLPARDRVLAARYLIVATLHQSVRGTILSAVDLATPRTCLIKHAQRFALVGRDGHDACDRLRHEMRILGRLSPDERFPQPLELIEQDEDFFLVMTEIEGITLEQHVRELGTQGRLPPTQQVLAWARELAGALATIHAQGIVYRDLKSPNIIVGDDGHLKIVDFELAYEIGQAPPEGRGTPGYLSPQRHEGQTPSVTDDVYGLGAILYFAVSGAEPSLAPRALHLLDRPLDLLNRDVDPRLMHLIARCLDPDPARRFPSMAAIESALSAMASETLGVADLRARPSGSAADEEEQYRQLAHGLADTLCRMARRAPDDGLFWLSTHENPAGISARDLSIGSAGPVLALSDLVSATQNEGHRDVLVRAAHSLMETRPSSGLLPGLYVGEAGIGVALLLTGKVLGDDGLIAAALDQGRFIASIPYVCPDMFNGTAGRLRFHLALCDVTSDPDQLLYAKQAGSELLKSAEGSDESGIWWTIPPGYGGLSGSAYLGYAHGAAGIADALLDLFEVSGDDRFLAAARGAGKWIAQHAIQTLADESGLDWPDVPGGSSIGPFWCHGAAGIGQFFLHAAQLGMMPEAEDLALRAANAAARGARWSGPTQCHGLAGNIEFLLDLFQWTRDPQYLDEARELGQLLRSYGRVSDGLLVWPSESPSIVTPDYTVGYAGVAACLLRLSAPARRPRQLSRRGLACNQWQPGRVHRSAAG